MTATITSKGQITIPKSIRNSLGATYGDTVDFLIVNGEIIVRRAEKMVDVEALNGILPSGKHASDSEIKKAKYMHVNRDFSDCLIGESGREFHRKTYTFDIGLKNDDNFDVIR